MINNSDGDIKELHWLIGMLQSINVGLVVIDREYNVSLWNDFMENRSGVRPEHVMNNKLLDVFPDLPVEWLQRKINSVFTLETRAFTTWEQRPYLFKFKNFRPITGTSEYMYQDITFLPLSAIDGSISHVGIIIYDVTDMAVNKLEREEANNELERLSRTDKLTKLNNRGYWEECLDQEFSRFKRTKQNTTLIMFDIDHFKDVNDTYGHQAGDEVIRQTSKTLRRTIRKTDIAGRYGGEEFGVILVDSDDKNTYILAERLRKRIEALVIKYENEKIKFKISIGISQLSEQTETYQKWLEQTDQALYYSKENGRNLTTIYSDIKNVE